MQTKVVARYRDGQILKGSTSDFSPLKTFFHLHLASGEVVRIDLANLKVVKVDTDDLKAAFFVKDFKGNKDHVDEYNDAVPGGGKKMKVQFFDGEVIIGYAMGYSPDRHGFFLIPADSGSNNERVFVVTESTRDITLL